MDHDMHRVRALFLVLAFAPLLALVPGRTPAEKLPVQSAGLGDKVIGYDQHAVEAVPLNQEVPFLSAQPAFAFESLFVSGRKETQAEESELKFIPPVYGIITSEFGLRKPPFGKKGSKNIAVMHAGIDLSAPKNALFVAPADGKVIAIERKTGYGALVSIEHAQGFETRYAHVGAVYVKVGDAVRTGQPLGMVGVSGRTTGPHIHFEMKRHGELIDPKPFLDLPTHREIIRLSQR